MTSFTYRANPFSLAFVDNETLFPSPKNSPLWNTGLDFTTMSRTAFCPLAMFLVCYSLCFYWKKYFACSGVPVVCLYCLQSIFIAILIPLKCTLPFFWLFSSFPIKLSYLQHHILCKAKISLPPPLKSTSVYSLLLT